MNLRDCKKGDVVAVLLFERNGDVKRAIPSTVEKVGRRWMHVKLGVDGNWWGHVYEFDMNTGSAPQIGGFRTHPRVFASNDDALDFMARMGVETEVRRLINESWRLRLDELTIREMEQLREMLRKCAPL